MHLRHFYIDPKRPDNSILEIAKKKLHDGKIIIYPTDTTYVFGANALDPAAVEKVYQIKHRSRDNPLHVVVADIKMAQQYAYFNRQALILAEHFLPGQLTIILPKRDIIPDCLVGGLNSLGIRIPDNRVCLALARKAKIPFTTTSANISGKKDPYDIDQIIEQFGSDLEDTDMIIDQGPLPGLKPSTLVDLTGSEPLILREGPISRDDIFKILNRGEKRSE